MEWRANGTPMVGSPSRRRLNLSWKGFVVGPLHLLDGCNSFGVVGAIKDVAEEAA
jgi:hypothetical protein